MGDIVGHRIRLCLGAVMSMLLLAAALLCAGGIWDEWHTPDMGDVRVQVNELVNAIESGKQYDLDRAYPYAIIQKDGTVIADQGIGLQDKVNLHQLGAGNKDYYLVPFTEAGNMAGMVYVELYPYFCGKNTAVIWGWSLAFFLILLFTVYIGVTMIRTVEKDIFEPIRQLHTSTHQILNGKLNQPVVYDYDGEIGALCHDFELMRRELLDGLKREQQLKEAEKLLMASISHDLRTPLATLQGYLESICIGVVTREEDIIEYCRSALHKTIFLSKMTNDILEHSEAELRALSIKKEEVYAGDFFGEMLATLSADAASRGMDLRVGEIPNMLLKLDKMRMNQVMENIVGNAFKYGKANGRIEISFLQTADLLYVSVKDNGQGIEPEDLPFVFDRFFRGSKARNTGIAGSGLGLSIAKYIVEQHGGSIACDSIFGTWTEVRFSIAI